MRGGNSKPRPRPRRAPSPQAPLVQQSSPVTGDSNTLVAGIHATGSNVYIGSPSKEKGLPIAPIATEPPNISCRGPFKRQITVQGFPVHGSYPGQIMRVRADMRAQSMAFRNIGLGVHGVTVHLDYKSDDGRLIAIDRGYWQDASFYHQLPKGDTRHLVVAAYCHPACRALGG